MSKKSIAGVMSYVLLFQCFGCATFQVYKPTQGWEGTINGEVSITGFDGQVLVCDEFAPANTDLNRWVEATVVKSDTLFSFISGNPVQIPMNLIQTLEVKSTSKDDEARLIIGILGALVLLVVILKPAKWRGGWIGG